MHCWCCAKGLPLTVADKLVLEADVESRVRGRSEKLTCLSDDILRATVVIAHSVLDLYTEKEELVAIHNLQSAIRRFGLRVPADAGRIPIHIQT